MAKTRKTKRLKRDTTRSVPLAYDEEAAIKTLATLKGTKPATLMRMLMYRGLASFLRDRAVAEPDSTEEDTFAGVREVIRSNPDTEGSFNLNRGGRQPLAKTGTK